ncbi:MAG: DNA methyltransferase Dim-2 [Watsoniomyces obsoletus]|nr:MAG: DNA methyltransferase Dim-2 [Watsoniomyces obsoletus]
MISRKEKEAEENQDETQRSANMAKNQVRLWELQVNAANESLAMFKKRSSNGTSTAETPKKKTRTIKPSSSKKKTKTQTEAIQRRTSSRLAGLEAESELAKRKAEEEGKEAAMQQRPRFKRRRRSGELNLGDILINGTEWDDTNNFLADVTRGGRRYDRPLMERDVSRTGDKELKALRKKMNGLSLYEGFEPNRTFSS